MNDENKRFISSNDFHNRILNVLEQKGITFDELYRRITNEIGYSISKNNLSIYFQRIPNVNFLVALSKALSVSTDYLLGLEDFDLYSEGFDYQFEKQRYKKYIGCFYFYFYPTVSNSPQKLIEAELKICQGTPLYVELTIPTDEDETKKYFGHFSLSKDYPVGYITMRGHKLGEIVHMSFCDPIINGKTEVTTIVGSMLSISSGDFKRVPVMSRFFISKKKINDAQVDVIKANLYLNSKYIYIDPSDILSSLANIDLDVIIKEKITDRLISAFEKKYYYKIEESYILNTLKNDFNLSSSLIEEIIAHLRLNSMKTANVKLNKTIDSRVFMYLNNKHNTSD